MAPLIVLCFLSPSFLHLDPLTLSLSLSLSLSVSPSLSPSLPPSLPPSQDLDSRDRNLVKEGQVFLKTVKKLYQWILFNDLLVFAHGDSRQSIVELQLSLEAVWVEDLEDLDPQTSQCKQTFASWPANGQS